MTNMSKIMLVEDDKSLREIYGVRLFAEGYDIISAGDGEEALALAIKERPKLIISDVMMPKISGFDMLDILRSTTETRDIKVIMMTALGSPEQRERGKQLGADRYLVKSQVGIEDVVRVVHDVLADQGGQQQAQPSSTIASSGMQAPPAALRSAAPSQPPSRTPQPPVAPMPVTQPPKPSSTQGSSIKTRVIQPLNDPTKKQVDMGDLVAKELSAGNAAPMPPAAPASVPAPTPSLPPASARPAPIPAAPPVAPAPPAPIAPPTPPTLPMPPAPPTSPPANTAIPAIDAAQEQALVKNQLNQFAAKVDASNQSAAPAAATPDTTNLPSNISISSDGSIQAAPPQRPQQSP